MVVRQEVAGLDRISSERIAGEIQELVLVGHAFYAAQEIGQIFLSAPDREIGLDCSIEFRDERGRPSGKHARLQIRAQDYYQCTSNVEARQLFVIRNIDRARHWLDPKSPVMLTTRTSEGKILWMNITDYLNKHGTNWRQIVFDGEPFTALNLARLRDRVLKE
jgi:hypothetical protein